MTKKYRTVVGKYPVRILCTDSNNKACPIVYEYCGPYFGRDTWLVTRTSLMGSNLCDIEEVPEEPIKEGMEFTNTAGTRLIVGTKNPDKDEFVIVYKTKLDSTWHVNSHANGSRWFSSDYIRQASQK